MPLTRRGFCAATLTAIAAPAILRAQTGAGVEIRAAAAGLGQLHAILVQRGGQVLLADAPRKEPLVQTNVYEAQEKGADAVVAKVIADNAGKHL